MKAAGAAITINGQSLHMFPTLFGWSHSSPGQIGRVFDVSIPVTITALTVSALVGVLLDAIEAYLCIKSLPKIIAKSLIRLKKSKLPSSTGVNEVTSSRRQTFKQIREKTEQAQRVSALPSNWNRYEEEFDSDSEDTSEAPDIIVPKRDFNQLDSFKHGLVMIILLWMTAQLQLWRLEDMKDQLRKRMFTKRIIRKIEFHIVGGLSIELNTYALIRPTVPGKQFSMFCLHGLIL
ncbi:hypothetical protein V6N11_033683 [Hibiscus sabdariffa]|uniref:Uncharacterized protein n=2 Tax=Hibiscus sabdariffa TaxID=183260 RepID=A0ABR2PYR8_9ROSI